MILEISAVIFFLIVLGLAFIAFKLLKKTAKMAFRLLVFVVLLLAAATGAVLILFLGGFLPGSQ